MELRIYNEDCMEVMARYPDNYFDLAVVDPPYGIGESGGVFRDRKGGGHRVLERKKWDNEAPDIMYFNKLLRVSKNQIIWGGNYFANKIPVSRCWLYWDKLMGGDFSDGELAWTSFNKVLKKFTKCNKAHGKIHPTQKPVELYKWIYQNYATEGMKILDTHLGSGSNAIAAYEMNMAEFVGAELDADYFEAASARIERAMGQGKLF